MIKNTLLEKGSFGALTQEHLIKVYPTEMCTNYYLSKANSKTLLMLSTSGTGILDKADLSKLARRYSFSSETCKTYIDTERRTGWLNAFIGAQYAQASTSRPRTHALLSIKKYREDKFSSEVNDAAKALTGRLFVASPLLQNKPASYWNTPDAWEEYVIVEELLKTSFWEVAIKHLPTRENHPWVAWLCGQIPDNPESWEVFLSLVDNEELSLQEAISLSTSVNNK